MRRNERKIALLYDRFTTATSFRERLLRSAPITCSKTSPEITRKPSRFLCWEFDLSFQWVPTKWIDYLNNAKLIAVSAVRLRMYLA